MSDAVISKAMSGMLRQFEAPFRVGVVFCSGDSAVSHLIQRVTNSPWSHVAIIYDFGRIVGCWYYEALACQPLRGPLPDRKLDGWKLARRKRRKYEIVWVAEWLGDQGVTSDQMRDSFLCADSYVGSATYGEWQLLQMWANIRFGRPVRGDDRRMVCSELVARALKPIIDLRAVFKPAKTFDEITPGDIWDVLLNRKETP